MGISNQMQKILLIVSLLFLTKTEASDFTRKAYAALPVENSYAFHKELSEWREPLRRDPAAKPGSPEMAILGRLADYHSSASRRGPPDCG